MKIQDMLFTRVGVLLVSKVEVLVDNSELNCWRKRNEEEERGRTTLVVAFDYGFLDTRKRRHVSNSDLSRQQVWSHGSDVL